MAASAAASSEPCRWTLVLVFDHTACRSDFVAALEALMKKQHFDNVLLVQFSGAADCGVRVQLFFAGMQRSC
jgi:hypothetical protein